ncbi:MAG: hypothetical protein VX794_07800 [Nitrospinota bacterium]|nr:hypothetical protein [Nitrospinota bacterium]
MSKKEGNIIHTSRAKIVKEPGKAMKTGFFEAFPDTPIPYGVHGGIKNFYKVDPVEERPATLDHLVASVAG